MFRVWAVLIFVAVVFWVFTIVDCAVQPATRHRAVSKPTWIAIVVLLPVLGGILWLAIGRTRPSAVVTPRAPDDDPEFLGRLGSLSDQDERIRRLEEELAQLDAEDDDPRWTTDAPPAPPAADATGATPDPPARDVERPGEGDDDVRGQRGSQLNVPGPDEPRDELPDAADDSRAVAAPGELDAPDARALPSPATDAASALLCALVDEGVRHVVVSPGSRSQALALVAAELEARGLVRAHVRVDERVAGFTALGIGRETGMPAVVVTTSGTAVANLLPAALEAHHAGVPLVLLTADRPPELRGVGANQTTRQVGIFSPSMRFEADLPVPERADAEGGAEQSLMMRAVAVDAIAAALGAGTWSAGPVHLNMPLREPLAGTIPLWLGAPAAELTVEADVDLDAAPVAEVPDAESFGALYQGGGGIGESDVPSEPDAHPHMLERGPRTIVVAGADAGPGAETLAHAGGWPLVAEIVSGSRFGRNLVHGYRGLLREPGLAGRIERVIVLGHPTLSREVAALLSRDDVEVIAVRGPGEPLNLNGATTAADAVAVTTGDADREWLGAWLRASRAASVDLAPPAPDVAGLSSGVPSERLGAISAELDAIRAPLDREALVDAVWRATWPHDRLVFGSSRLVRVADAVLGGKKVPVHANRGLAGIDGTVATALGIAVASQADGAAGVTRVLLGDLALLHDVGALAMPPAESEPRVQLIVGNDGGGTIFDGLEVAHVAGPAAMDRMLYTPQHVRLDQLALAYGWEYQRVTTRAALDQALTSPVGGRQLIEVPLPR